MRSSQFPALEERLGEAAASANEWKLKSIRARSDLNGLRGVFNSNREKLAAARAALKEVVAPPVLRLFPHTLFGIGFWVCFLLERYAFS